MDFNSKEKVDLTICPYCNVKGEIVDSSKIYGKSYGNILQCPQCYAYVGCHQGKKSPLGLMANESDRYYRKIAHEALAPLWKSGKFRRNELYRLAANRMNILPFKCHIAFFRKEQCKKFIEICMDLFDESIT